MSTFTVPSAGRQLCISSAKDVANKFSALGLQEMKNTQRFADQVCKTFLFQDKRPLPEKGSAEGETEASRHAVFLSAYTG